MLTGGKRYAQQTQQNGQRCTFNGRSEKNPIDLGKVPVAKKLIRLSKDDISQPNRGRAD
jgi:hypothetical protein